LLLTRGGRNRTHGKLAESGTERGWPSMAMPRGGKTERAKERRGDDKGVARHHRRGRGMESMRSKGGGTAMQWVHRLGICRVQLALDPGGTGMWILRQCEVRVCTSVMRDACDGNLYLFIC